MAVLKKIGVYSLSKVYSLIMAFIGLILGSLYSILFIVNKEEAVTLGINPVYGLVSIILFPLLYAIFGFIFGGLSAYLYNLVSRWTGGVEIEIDNKKH